MLDAAPVGQFIRDYVARNREIYERLEQRLW